MSEASSFRASSGDSALTQEHSLIANGPRRLHRCQTYRPQHHRPQQWVRLASTIADWRQENRVRLIQS